MARIPYVDPDDASPEVREVLATLPDLKIFRLLAHAETAFTPYLTLTGVLLARLELDPQLRELAILLVASRANAEYEWTQHVGVARGLGVADDQIDAIERGDLEASCLGERAVALLRFCSQVIDRGRADDATFAALSKLFPPRQVVELLLVVGTYHMLALVMTSLDIDLDAAVGTTVVDEATRRFGD